MARGKVYTTAPLLYNDQGDPIPQYLDVSDKTDSPQGSFKPLTNDPQDVRLTGSNVELAFETDLSIPAGSYYDILPSSTKVEDFTELEVAYRLKSTAEHEIRVWRFIGLILIEDDTIIERTSDDRNIGRTKVEGNHARIRINNRSSEDEMVFYACYVKGVV